MPLPVSHAKVDHVDALTGRLAAVELKEEEEARNTRGFNPFAPYLEQGLPRFVEHLTREIIPERLSSLRQTRQLLVDESCPLYRAGREFQVKHGISEASFQNWKELLCGWLDFPVILLLNPSPFDVLGYEQMVQQSPTLGWLEKNLEVLKLKLHDVIVMDTFPMVTDKLLGSKRFAEDLAELVTDSFELTWTCLRYIHPQIVISCQCSSKVRNDKWGSSGDLRAEELSSSEAGARQELVKMMDVDGHQMFVVQGVHPQYVMQHNQMMEEVLKKKFTKVLGPFGRWKERRLAERREAARAEVILGKESVRDGMKSLMKQMQLFNQICRQEGRNGAELSDAAKRVEEWRKQIEGWLDEMDD
ncbi:uncharacterized protein AKAW2_50593A [Aspergillus luchuensis]|uniref:Uncharacterized protein n=1 Tax=Aspergillus kawachii TaxID=1069201 RepID=A0A7R8A0D7_ASPKA|nr:uncharacterized protein AKAW2_50593A [Aspergillus luchuensis]BCS00252.1 hypothetical protein AKAW2_50593A [Aspergillus luchuensis]BCS12043.1 hypothetical protein ALUC_50089A [Aspergillus luchuensis]GAA92842.1 hypothetical protein AKAW_10955 [Aspergillus luchuensis IFO 4308]